MKADKNAPGADLSNIPGEFRENYLFLTKLIECNGKNNSVTCNTGYLVDELAGIRGLLNKRQLKILTQFLEFNRTGDKEALEPPVPAELEAAIRVKKRSWWLPWEAEAIRKIERWRGDVTCVANLCRQKEFGGLNPVIELKTRRPSVRRKKTSIEE